MDASSRGSRDQVTVLSRGEQAHRRQSNESVRGREEEKDREREEEKRERGCEKKKFDQTGCQMSGVIVVLIWETCHYLF